MTPTITTIIEDEYGCTIQVITNGESEFFDWLWLFDMLHPEDSDESEGNDGYIWS